jgi:hypothetical protein
MVDACTEQWTEVLDETVAKILRRTGVKRPPVNAIDIANLLGFRVLWDDHQTGRARIAEVRSAPARKPRPAIFLRRDPRPERLQWAVAHEIGEQCAESVCREVGVDVSDSPPHQREQIANRLATRLLLPSRWFVRDAAAVDYDLLELKDQYATASHELITRRMLDLPPPVIVSIFDNGKLQFRRWNLAAPTPRLTPDELRCWRHAHESGESVRENGVARIDAWPIHEPSWKREILRCEPNDGVSFDA